MTESTPVGQEIQMTWTVAATTIVFLLQFFQQWQKRKHDNSVEGAVVPWTKDDEERLRGLVTCMQHTQFGLTTDEHKQLFAIFQQLDDVHDWLDKDDPSGRKLYYQSPSLRQEVHEIKELLVQQTSMTRPSV